MFEFLSFLFLLDDICKKGVGMEETYLLQTKIGIAPTPNNGSKADDDDDFVNLCSVIK